MGMEITVKRLTGSIGAEVRGASLNHPLDDVTFAIIHEALLDHIYRLAATPEYRRRGIARRLVAEIGSALFAKGGAISALVVREHRWARNFWESLRDLGYEYDPSFARYIMDRGSGPAHQSRSPAK